MDINPKLIAFGNEPHIELEAIKPSKIKILFNKPMNQIPYSIELIQWKFFDIVKFFRKFQRKHKKIKSRLN